MKEFLQRAAAFLMLAVYSLSIAPAAEIARSYEAGRRTLDAYLERAQIQGDKEKFEKIAEQGLGAAVAEWEQSSLELKLSDYDEWLLQKDAFEENLEAYKENAFAKWILKKQNAQKTEIQKTALYEELHSAALAFSYTKADGTQTRIVSKDFIDEAKTQWSEIADGIVQKYVDEWNAENFGLDERELFGLKLTEEEKTELVQNAQNESAAFLQDEALSIEIAITNSLVNELLYDHDSLKKLSDAQAAAVIAKQLADDVDAQTSDSMARLFDSMQTELDDIDANDVNAANAKKEWLEKFERELQAGLEKWNEAERGFLAARVEWEQSAENVFLNDNQKWMEAYNELEKRKSEWAEKIEQQIQDGKAKWETKLTNLENEVDEYFEEFQYKLALEMQQKEQLVDAEIEAYNQCREILVTAQNGITNWYARWCEKYNGVYSYWKTEDSFGRKTNLNSTTTQNLKNEISEWKTLYVKTAKDIINKYYKELNELYKNYSKKSSNSSEKEREENKKQQEKLKKEIDEIKKLQKKLEKFSQNSSIEEITEFSKEIIFQKSGIKKFCPELYQKIGEATWGCFDSNATLWKASNELFSWFDTYDKYSAEAKKSLTNLYAITGGGIENSDYDEIENENSKLSALAAYWKSREKVALAVYEYSQNSSSSLEAVDVTKENLEKTQKNYEALKNEYQSKLQSLLTFQEKIEKAKANYFAASDAVNKAILKIEEERKIYDELYEQWDILKNDKSFDTLFSLSEKLDTLELNDTNYEKLLLKYYASFQEKENIELTEKIKGIKEIFENGSGGNQTSQLLTPEEVLELELDLDGYDYSKVNIQNVENRIFSNAEITSLKEKLKKSISKNEIDFTLLESLSSEIEVMDKMNCELLKTELKNYNEKGTSIENIKKCVSDIIEHCELELSQRAAIILLLDGSAEEIESFFSENSGYEEVYQNYKKYSFALLNKEQSEARAKVLQTIKNYPHGNIEQYFAALDNAGDGLNKAGKAILACYKNLVRDEKNNSNTEADLTKKIHNLFTEQKLEINSQNFHQAAFEDFFSEKNTDALNYKIQENKTNTEEKAKNTDEEFSLLNTTAARAEIISQMQKIYDKAFNRQKNIDALDKKIEAQANVIKQAQNDYENKVQNLRGDSPNSALNLYISACDAYNLALKETQDFYEQVENARREYRIAEEIYFYAENEYLHGNVDVETPLNEAREKLSQTRAALAVLEEIKAEKENAPSNFDSCKEFNEYKESARQYYKARVLAYEYEQMVAEQKQKFYQAQLAEKAAFERLVCEYSDNISGTEFQPPSITSDFITAEKVLNCDGTYSYSFSLNPIAKINSRSAAEKTKSDEILKEYYTDFCIESENVMGEKSSMTRAKKDAFDFLCSFENKNYNIEDVALAVLYLKMQGNAEQKARWLEQNEDITKSENYSLGDIPEKAHSVEIWNAYESGRKSELKRAYDKVINNNGVNDIRDYILYSQTNINSSLNLYQRQHDALSTRALENAINKIKDKMTVLRAAAAVQMGLVILFTAITNLPFFIGAWAAVPLAAATVVLVSLTGAASKLGDIKDDIQEIQRGYEECLSEKKILQNAYLDSWKRASETRKAEEERYNVLLYGKSKSGDKQITWSDFESSIKELTRSENSIVEYSYFSDLHDAELNTKNLKEFFVATTKNENFTTISEVVTKMYSTLKESNDKKTAALNEFIKNETQKKEAASNSFYATIEKASSYDVAAYKENLKKAASAAWGKDSFDKTKLNLELISFYDKDLLHTLPVRIGNSTEEYVLEIFENMKRISLSQLADENLAKIENKELYFSILQEDLQEQYSAWLKKINSATEIGIDEWQRADEQLNAAYNSWQKEWLCEYAQKNDEWDENYKNFLQDKQNWINQSYAQSSAQDVNIKNYAAVSKMKSATKMDGTISEYVSSLYDTDKFLRLADFAKNILSFADDDSRDIRLLKFDSVDSSILKDYDDAVAKQSEIESDMKKAAAKYQAEIFQAQAEENLKNYFAQIQERNKGVDDWELDLVRKAGYTVDSEIHRNAVVDSTAFKTIREKQTVHRYEFFNAEAPEISIDTSNYQGSSEYFIMKKIEEIKIKIQEWQEKIFGVTDKAGNMKTSGELNEHIGESPTFIDNVDLTKSRQENIKDAGSGEMGLILSDFQWNSMKNSQGYAELSKAIYDQKLTTGDGWFKLPTIREIASIICDIVSNCGAAWMKYFDDMIFGTMDLAMQYKTFDEVANDALRQAAISAASHGISSAGSAIFSKLGDGISKGAQVLNGVERATVGYANSVAASYINSFDFIRGTMDWEQAASAWTSASNLTSAAGSFLGGTIGEFNNVDGKGKRLSAKIFGDDIERMNHTIGSLSGAALNYLATGDISFNVANINGVGLLELGFHDGEFGSKIGEGGTNLSLFSANVYNQIDEDGNKKLTASLNDNIFQTFAKGTKTVKQVSDLKKLNSEETTVRLNSANLLGWSGTKNNVELGKDLFSGKQKVTFAELDGDATYSAREGEDIIINSQFLSDDKDKQAMIAPLIAYQNAMANCKSAAESGYTVDEKKLLEEKKDDGTNRYTKEDIENMKNKPGNDAIIAAMTDTAAAFVASHDILGSEYNSVANTENFSTLGNCYKKGGFTGVFALFAEINEAEKKMQKEDKEKLNSNGGDYGGPTDDNFYPDDNPYSRTIEEKSGLGLYEIGFENVMRLNWYQNADGENSKINRDVLLGFALSKEDYTRLAKKNAAERYAEKKLAEMGLENECTESMKQRLMEEALEDEEILKDNGYVPKEKTEITLGGHGCTLSTAAYIAYSITGKIVSLKEANEIVKKNNLFHEAVDEKGNIIKDENGISEKTLLYAGYYYKEAVNAIAGGNFLETDGKTFDEYSSSNSSTIFNKLITNYNRTDEVYFTHMRLYGEHSVLFKSMTFSNAYDSNSATVTILNPWKQTGSKKYDYLGTTKVSFSEISRADFYKLTEEGKKYYKLRQEFENASTSKEHNR